MATDVPLRVPRHRVHPNARWFWAIQGLAPTVLLAVLGTGLAVLLPADAPGWLRGIAAVLPWLAVPVGLLLVVVAPLLRYQVHRWEITAEAVYTLEGWLVRVWRIVPVARIQTVDTTRGPVQQLLGLATVMVRTASHAGSTGIWHLDAATADAVAHDLALRANAVPDDVS